MVQIEISKVSVLKKQGSNFLLKSQWKGVGLYFGERSYVLLLRLSGGTEGELQPKANANPNALYIG